MVQSARRLTARPAESEHPGTEINHLQEQQRFAKKSHPAGWLFHY
jgi:hypothetical protein